MKLKLHIRRIIYIVFAFFNLLIFIIFIKHIKYEKKKKTNILYKYILNPIEIFSGIFLFSSFREKDIIRLITFNERIFINIKNLSCEFKGRNNYKTKLSSIKYSGVHEKYYNLFCNIPYYSYTSDYIYVSNKKIKLYNNFNKKNSFKLLFCLTTVFSYNDIKRLIEFVEYYRHFGVEKFIVYNTNCSEGIKNVFKYYSDIGIMDIIYDNFTHNLYEKKRFHVWKQNDCFHRYKNIAKRIIFTDHDEIIYSPKYSNSENLFNHLNPNASSYHFYPKLIITKGKGFFINGYYSICPNDLWKFVINNSKCVLQVVVHDIIIKQLCNCFKEKVSTEYGYIIHARNNQSRHSRVCKKWNYTSNYFNQMNILHKNTNIILLMLKNKKM